MKMKILLFFLVSLDLVAGNQVFPHLHGEAMGQGFVDRYIGIVGCAVMILMAVLLSSNRKKIPWRLIIFGLGLQFLFAYSVLKLKVGRSFFETANNVIVKILSFSNEGAHFLFGNLILDDIPIKGPGELNMVVHTGSLFAFSVLPTIIFFSALTAVLYHVRILEWIVRGMSYVMCRTMKVSGAESFSAAVNIFVGQTEAPLLIKPFLGNMTRSEIMAVMTGGFSNVSGGVMAAYVAILATSFPDIAGHLLAASIMSAPASLVFAKIIMPETEKPVTSDSSGIILEKQDLNILDAAARGTTDGLFLALNVGAMLIAFIALIACLNFGFSTLSSLIGFPGVSLELIFSKFFSPLAWLLGVPWVDAHLVGGLLGTKTVMNEMVAYLNMAPQIQAGNFQYTKSIIIATYALCGFANFSSIGIQVGGLSTMAPHRRSDFAKLGLKAMIAGSLASFQTAAMAGILL